MRPVPYDNAETIIILDLYKRVGHKVSLKDPELLEVVEVLSKYRGVPRTPSGVAHKLYNFQWIDPDVSGGYRNCAKIMRPIWEIYGDNPELGELASIYRNNIENGLKSSDPDFNAFFDPKPNEEVVARIVDESDQPAAIKSKMREERRLRDRAQEELRETVLHMYGHRCCVMRDFNTDILLEACHIIPRGHAKGDLAWSGNDPTNMLCMNPFHHAAFDAGLFTIDSKLRFKESPAVKHLVGPRIREMMFDPFDGEDIMQPTYKINPASLKYHRENIFLKT